MLGKRAMSLLLYPFHLKMHDSAGIINAFRQGKALIEENSYSIVEINNAA
jgi:hypothetical protein